MDEDEISRHFEGRLDKVEEGDMSEVISKVFSAFTRKKVSTIKVGGFNAEKDDKFKSIRCSMKAVDGQLYPLDKCFFFIASKPVMIEFERISSIEFNRVDKGALERIVTPQPCSCRSVAPTPSTSSWLLSLDNTLAPSCALPLFWRKPSSRLRSL